MSSFCHRGTVDSYDGGASVMVRRGETLDPLPFLHSYIPSVGDPVVVLALSDGRSVVLGRPDEREAMNAHQC